MRITLRNSNNFTYWKKRWINIPVDKEIVNKEIYPLKYALMCIKNKKQKILEAGCGNGRILNFFFNKDYKIIGIDFIKQAILKIKKKNNKVKVFCRNIIKTKFKSNFFDVILAFGLLHNFPINKLNRCFKEIYRLLKFNGILCFSFRSDNISNLMLDRLKRNNGQNLKFHKLNLKEKELFFFCKNNNLEVINTYYVVNMPILFHFSFFRKKSQKKFNETLARVEGYKLNFFGNIINNFLKLLFIKHYCNLYVIFARKV